MAKSEADVVQWQDEVPEEDYMAAQSFLSLVSAPVSVPKVIAKLRAASVELYKATDIFRASKVRLPDSDDRPCRKEIKKIHKGQPLAPVLLVRDPAHNTVIIADGYHRICAAFRIDPDVILHCKVA